MVCYFDALYLQSDVWIFRLRFIILSLLCWCMVRCVYAAMQTVYLCCIFCAPGAVCCLNGVRVRVSMATPWFKKLWLKAWFFVVVCKMLPAVASVCCSNSRIAGLIPATVVARVGVVVWRIDPAALSVAATVVRDHCPNRPCLLVGQWFGVQFLFDKIETQTSCGNNVSVLKKGPSSGELVCEVKNSCEA